MRLPSIFAFRRLWVCTLLLAGACAVVPACAQPAPDDEVIAQMRQAFQRSDTARLSALLPQARGHILEPWAAYWELKARLPQARADEVQAFLSRYAGTYQEDRLRNDWLLLLGQRRQWNEFLALLPGYRMQDDREVQCYAVLAQMQTSGVTPTPAQAETVRRNWLAQREVDDGCQTAAQQLVAARLIAPAEVWKKARLAMEANRPAAARAAVALVAPDALPTFDQINASAVKFLTSAVWAASQGRKEMVALALIRMASADPDAAAVQLENKWGPMLSAEERDWLWGHIGRVAATRLSPQAGSYFANVSRNSSLSDDMLGWKVRAALRLGQWKDVGSAIDAMSEEGRQDPTWVYWKARALLARSGGEGRSSEALALLQPIASTRGFYELLALELLGQRAQAPARPTPLTAQEKAAARANPALQRALYAIGMGLRPEGVREWNYATNLHDKGGMDDRALLAAADLACQRQVYDRCINTSERTKNVIDIEQRYPMPFHDTVLRKSQAIGLDPAYVYGLIRQESRFIMDARSGVGASGLMQIMPATARWTAHKIGLPYSPGMINDRVTNIVLGTNYLKLALDDFDGSMPLAAAAYNAGPGRPRAWRNGPVLEGAIWAENIPFAETRDYVKKVLANTTNYALLITGQPQSLRERLGQVGPRATNTPDPSSDLP